MARILITGSEGSLGQTLIPYLLDQGHFIVGVDNLMRYGTRQQRAINISNRYCWCPIDMTDIKEDEWEWMHDYKFDYIFHLAAQIYGVGGFNAKCADILADDIAMTRNAYNIALKSGAKMIFVSSSMVYENCITSREEDPDFNVAPMTDYGLSKFTNERICRAFQKEYGIDYTIWRPFNIITPYEIVEEYDPQGYGHVFADFIHNIVKLKKNPLPIFGDGLQIRCFTWHEEIAEAIAKYSFLDQTKNETYNIGSTEQITMKTLANTIFNEARDMGLLENDGSFLSFEHYPAFPNDVRVRYPDITKAKNDLGFEAKIKVKHSIRECLKYINTVEHEERKSYDRRTRSNILRG